MLGVAGTIVAVAFLTGPFGPLGVPLLGDHAAPGTGDATVPVVAGPDHPSLDRARQTDDAFYVRVPHSVIDVSDLQGLPSLTYTVSIREPGYSRCSIYFLGAAAEGQLAVNLERDTPPAG